MGKLNRIELIKRKAYLARISKPSKTIKEIKKECMEIAKQALEKNSKKLETQKQKDKFAEILKNNLRLLEDINNNNKEEIYEIFKKLEIK